MFVGHALLAFALVALGARRLGWHRSAALQVGLVAACFATLPDVDMAYALTGLLDVGGAVDSFWAASRRVHRGATHSLVVGVVAAGAALLVARWDARPRRVGVAVLASLVAVTAVLSGPVGGFVLALYALVAVAIVAAAVQVGLSPRAVGIAALVGLLSHPFGDLTTGSPPALLYPVDVTLITDRVALAADPTLHLLGAFAIELATIWLAAAVWYRFEGRSLLAHVDRRAALGVGYAGAALAIPAPTLDVSSPFVFSVLAVGAVGLTPAVPRFELPDARRALATGLAAVTLAALAYLAAYLAV